MPHYREVVWLCCSVDERHGLEHFLLAVCPWRSCCGSRLGKSQTVSIARVDCASASDASQRRRT
eukprot:5635105-Amphidinium_carterae.1